MSTIKRTTTNYNLRIPVFDAPGWGREMERNFDIIDASIFTATGLARVRGVWDNNITYEVAERIIDNTNNTLWACEVGHTSPSTGTFADYRAANPTHWTQITNIVSPRGQWKTNTNYIINDIVFDGYVWAIAVASFVSGATLADDISDGNFVVITDSTDVVTQTGLDAAATEAARDFAYLWANEAVDDPVDDGVHTGFSAYHWATKALAADPDLKLNVDGSNVGNEAAQAAFRAAIGVNLTDLFVKPSHDEAAFTRTGNATASIKSGVVVEVGGNIYTYHSAEAITMPSLTAGDDVAVWILPDGQPVASLDFVSPPVAGARRIGGFHYAPGGNASGLSTGGNSTPQINPYSFWDLKFRPQCPDPRGMTLVANQFWCDIYLCGVNHSVDGTSKYNVPIADGSSPAKIPAMFGGNGTTAYSSFNWWQASEVLTSHGKDSLSYAEFCAAMYGVVENTSGGTDPVSTILRPTFTSIWGVMLATGNLWVWGRDFGGDHAAADWVDTNGGRGQVYMQSNAALLGGYWAHGVFSGSRCSLWGSLPSNSNGAVGARGRSDHLYYV